MPFEIRDVVQRLNAVLPSGWAVRLVSDDAVKVYEVQNEALGSVARPFRGTADGVRALLNFVQDEVSLGTKEPWPSTRGAQPVAQVTESRGRLHASYSLGSKVVLDLGEF